MQSTISIPLQPMAPPSQTLLPNQIQPLMIPSETQITVIRPSNIVLNQLQMDREEGDTQQLNTAQMSFASQMWKSDINLSSNGSCLGLAQESLRYQQNYQLLHSDYQSALLQIQTLQIRQNLLDKKLWMDELKYQKLHSKYLAAVQWQNKYHVLSKMHTKTIKQLRLEQDKCNILSTELAETARSLENERRKTKCLNSINAESKNLSTVGKKRDKLVNANQNENKYTYNERAYNSVHQSSLKQRSTSRTRSESCHQLVRNFSNTISPVQSKRAKASNGKSNHTVIPPGFENCARVSARNGSKAE